MITGKRKPKESERMARATKKVVDQSKEIIEAAPNDKLARSSLMLMAKVRGIKYFRILNRKELEKILTLTLDEDRNVADDIIEGAKKRWKAGWGTKKAVTA